MSGKPDVLRRGQTLPCVCRKCYEITDRLMSFELDKNSNQMTEQIDPKCYKCGSNSFYEWDYNKKPCPKCQTGTMILDPDGTEIMVD